MIALISCYIHLYLATCCHVDLLNTCIRVLQLRLVPHYPLSTCVSLLLRPCSPAPCPGTSSLAPPLCSASWSSVPCLLKLGSS